MSCPRHVLLIIVSVSIIVTLSSHVPGPGQWQSPGQPSHGQLDANMMMQQIQELQQTVRQLATGGGAGGHGAAAGGFGSGSGGFGSGNGGFGSGTGDFGPPGTQGRSNYQSGPGTWSSGAGRDQGGQYGRGGGGHGQRRQQQDGEDAPVIKEEEQTVLLVSNIPPNLSNPDSLFYAFEKFGTVLRIKILYNKRSTALIQMSDPSEAKRAIEEQDSLNRVGTEIYVNYSAKFSEVKIPTPGSMHDDGLTKDFTTTAPGSGTVPPPPPPLFGGGFDGGMGGGMFHDRGRGGMNMNSGYDDYGGRGGGQTVLLISNIPDDVANLDCIFNMVGVYGDVLYIKILHNKRDCAMVQLAKPHQAQAVKQYLDTAKLGGNKLCVSFSRVETFLNKRIPEDDELQREYLNSRLHRFRNQQTAAKLQKNLGPPSCTLHVANLPEGFGHSDVKVENTDNITNLYFTVNVRICSLRKGLPSKTPLSVAPLVTWLISTWPAQRRLSWRWPSCITILHQNSR